MQLSWTVILEENKFKRTASSNLLILSALILSAKYKFFDYTIIIVIVVVVAAHVRLLKVTHFLGTHG